MVWNLLGIFLFLSLFHYSIQLECYECGGNRYKPWGDGQRPIKDCPAEGDEQFEEKARDFIRRCSGSDVTACIKSYEKIKDQVIITRDCNDTNYCKNREKVAKKTDKDATVDCYECTEDKCNSAMYIIASSSPLTIALSFVAFKIFFS